MKLHLDGWNQNLKFSSAHLIPHHNKCGRLHGHTYAVHIEIEGTTGSEGIVMDFGLIKDTLRRTLKKLDHRLIVPARNKTLIMTNNPDGQMSITIGSKHYVIPEDDIILLDIESSTAEHLSLYILNQLKKTLRLNENIVRIAVGLDEGIGQGAWCSSDVPGPQ